MQYNCQRTEAAYRKVLVYAEDAEPREGKVGEWTSLFLAASIYVDLNARSVHCAAPEGRQAVSEPSSLWRRAAQ